MQNTERKKYLGAPVKVGPRPISIGLKKDFARRISRRARAGLYIKDGSRISATDFGLTISCLSLVLWWNRIHAPFIFFFSFSLLLKEERFVLPSIQIVYHTFLIVLHPSYVFSSSFLNGRWEMPRRILLFFPLRLLYYGEWMTVNAPLFKKARVTTQLHTYTGRASETRRAKKALITFF